MLSCIPSFISVLLCFPPIFLCVRHQQPWPNAHVHSLYLTRPYNPPFSFACVASKELTGAKTYHTPHPVSHSQIVYFWLRAFCFSWRLNKRRVGLICNKWWLIGRARGFQLPRKWFVFRLAMKGWESHGQSPKVFTLHAPPHFLLQACRSLATSLPSLLSASPCSYFQAPLPLLPHTLLWVLPV